ncbi:MAG: cation-translocating P-type ATPase [Saprospiraceae bacterium]|nr:cation-translocating P-type ATPase [Saprospiraceae bacterium]
MQPYRLNQNEVLEQFETSANGLTDAEAEERLSRQGPNKIEAHKKSPILWMFFRQFADFIILVLIVAAVMSGWIGDLADALIILIIVVLNATVGFVQEYKADRALEALKKMAVLHSKVIRNGEVKDLLSESLVTGDLVLLESGNSVPADLRLLEAHGLKLDESSLTGESVGVDKIAEQILEEHVELGDMRNLAYKGTTVTNGRAKGVVIATGMNTELGRIASMLQLKESDTPLKIRMKEFGKKLSFFIILICFLIFLVGILRGENLVAMLLISISLAVAAIPEALPALITVSLANGARRMVRKNALIRKLPAVETLGSVSIICTDKTGTLTLNKMKVLHHHIQDGAELENIPLLWLGVSLNQDVQIDANGQMMGDSTELAMVTEFIQQFGLEKHQQLRATFPRSLEIPFDSERKLMTTIHRANEKYLVVCKGAIEAIIQQSSIRPELSSELQKIADAWASTGHRVIAFAYKMIDALPDDKNKTSLESNLIPCGLLAMMDPPRPEVLNAIDECKKAGVKTIMITGDHLLTANAIAHHIGLVNERSRSVSGKELSAMTEEEFMETVEKISVYARVSPEQKLKIIRTLQKKGHFVAMTGDGVNDAPSLKAADIGVAMGISGTDVSKESADMVLLDDRFGTIVSAIKEGRRIYDNIRKFVRYIMTCNSAEIWTLFLAPFVGLPIPLLPVHILWINLVTDGLPGLALAGERAEKDIMSRPPRPATESLFAQGIGLHIVWVGILMAGLTLGVQAWSVHQKMENWQTMVFTVLAFLQLAHALSIRGERTYLFKQGIFTNKWMIIAILFTFLLQLMVIYHPFMNRIFKTQPLDLNQLLICIGVAAVLFHAVEIEKWIKYLIRKRNHSM